MNVVNTRISQRYDTLQNWTQRNPTLLEGELAVVATDNQTRFKIGDGQHTFNELNFIDQLKLTTVSAFANILSVNNAAVGFQNTVGTHSLAAGIDTSANGQHAIALGYKAAASSNGAFVFNGDQNYLAQPYYDHGVGTFNVNAPLSNVYIEDNDIKTALSDEGFVLSASISSKLEDIDQKIFISDAISGVAGYDKLSVVKLSANEYKQLVASDATLSNALYIVEDDYIDAYGEQIKNVAPPTDLSDAATKEYVDNALTNVQIPTDLSAFTNSPGYTTNVGTITGITMNGASKGTSGNVNLGTVLTAHQSLSNCLQNNSSYNSINLTANSQCTFNFPHINLPDTSILFGDLDAESLYAYWHRVELKEKDAAGGYSSVKITTTPDIQIAYVAGNGPEPPKTPAELMSGIKFTGGIKNSPVTSSLADLIYTKNETSSATEISTAVSQKSTVSFNRITTSGTNIGSITIDGTTTEIYAPTGGGGGSSGYALETAQLVADSGSLTCAVNDQAITTIQVSSSSTPVVVQLPAQPEDGARDFILRIEISSSSAPTFTFSGVNETIDFDSEDDDWAVLEPGLNLISFTETKRGAGTNSGGSPSTYCTVTFDIENGQNANYVNAIFVNPSDATRQVEAGQPVGTLPTLNYNSSYTFLGWYTTTSSATGQQVTNQTVITNDTTFYAFFAYVGGGGSNN